MDICWFNWPQSKAALCIEALDFILSLDIDADVWTLKELNIRGRPIQWFVASTSLLKTGARAGLSLYNMATLCYRDDTAGVLYPQDPSRLEEIVYSTISLADALMQVSEDDRTEKFGVVWGYLCNAAALVQFPPVTPRFKDADLEAFLELSTAPYEEWASRVMIEAVSDDGSNYIDSDDSTIPRVEDGDFEFYFNAIVGLLIRQEVALFISES